MEVGMSKNPGETKRRKPKAAISEPTPAPQAEAPQPSASPAPPGTSAGTKLGTLIGLVAAMVLAVLVNVLGARHYRRWDFTRGGLYTLSAPTVQTLHELGEPVHVEVLLPGSDPITLSLRHLLESYRAETTRLEVRFIDPDKEGAALVALRSRYGDRVVAGRTAAEAVIVVSRGDRAQFLALRDLVEIEDENDVAMRPRLEQALTGAVRAVVSTERPAICFVAGHGEATFEKPGAQGGGALGKLRDRLLKNGYEVRLASLARGEDEDKDRSREPFAACNAVIVAGPSERWAEPDVARLKAFVETGGNALIALGPVPAEDDGRHLDLGLGPVLALGGLEVRHDFVIEADPRLRAVSGVGETFLPTAKAHPITEPLIRAEEAGAGALLTVASSIAPTGAGSAAPAPLLVTSDSAFGMVDFFTWAKAKKLSAPEPTAADHKGPLTVAVAAELPKKPGKDRGPRMVVVGSASALVGENWDSDDLRGTALFVESAIAWITARPLPIDVPNKWTSTAGLRLSEDSLSSIFRYVVVFVPLASVLVGAAVFLRRRATERRGTRKGPAGA
jgi:hypothetical protein